MLRRALLSASAVCIFTIGETWAQAVPVPTPVSGEVVKIDQSAGKMTLRHGPIKNLDMDGMTMVFRVADPAMLARVKAGDKVTFEADRINGALTVTKIDKAR
jgi:Cu(I)/Ag(I) efflux system protein CusF